MKTWQIVALIGTIIFLFSGVLPLISIQFIGTFSISLFDMYGQMGSAPSMMETSTEMTEAFSSIAAGLLITVILFPITVIVGFISLATSPKLAIVAGVLGIICWLGSLSAVLQLKSIVAEMGAPFGAMAASLIQIGYGVYIGILGAIILLVSYFIATSEAKKVAEPTAPPSQTG